MHFCVEFRYKKDLGGVYDAEKRASMGTTEPFLRSEIHGRFADNFEVNVWPGRQGSQQRKLIYMFLDHLNYVGQLYKLSSSTNSVASFV